MTKAYQFVIQFPEGVLDSLDLEDEIAEALGNPLDEFLKERKLLGHAALAYRPRLPDGSPAPAEQFVVLWPEGYRGKFSV